MRLLCAFAIAAVLSLTLLAIDCAPLQAKIVCGNFGQGFTCKVEPGPGAQFGKNATPGAAPPAAEPSPEVVPPDGTWQGTTIPTESGQGAPAGAPDPTACQNGMVGTPPNCRCPKNSELLGGNCVHYTASACSSGMAPDALPQACRGVEEKVSCTLRQDGLKDCCCVTYDKF
jgi:hypothetical protein